MVRQTLHFSGRVQGVGFRYTAQALARGFALSGYVQNLPDGRVRLVAEGEPEEIDRFINAIRSQMSGYVRNVEQFTEPATGEFAGFSIQY